MAENKKKLDYKLLLRVYQYIKPFKVLMYSTVAIITTLSFLTPVRPVLIGYYAIDKYVVNSQPEALLNIILIIVGLLFIESVLQFFQTYFSNVLGQSIAVKLREDVYKHILNFKLKYFDTKPVGQLVTRVVSDIEGVSNIFSEGVLTIVGDILKLLLVLVTMFFLNWKMSILVLIPIPILIYGTKIFRNVIKKAFIEVRNKVSQMNTFVQEHVSGIALVQIFNRQKEESSVFEELNEAHKKANIKSIWAYSIFFPAVEILQSLSIAFIIWYGGHQLLEGVVEKGELVTFILFVHMLYRPIRQLADRFNTLQMGIVNAERVFDILDTEESIDQKENIVPASFFTGNIEFKNVWFTYTNENNNALKDVSFSINSGETLAIVGATGAGKSSIVNLLSRFYEFQKGQILIDDYDIRSLELSFLRQNVAVILQDVFLFSDTILNNITLHNKDISLSKVIEVAKMVGIHDFIMTLPNGYNFMVNERGSVLSVGQRQLLAFLRAYLYNPKVLILDEATSSIDTESEFLIQKATQLITKGRTSIVIAHRLSTIQNADQILVMEKGEIIEKGNHQELLILNGQYKQLYDLQFSKVNED